MDNAEALRALAGFDIKRHGDGSIRVSWRQEDAHKSIWCNPPGSDESPMDDMAENMLWLLADALLRAHLTDPGYVRVPVEPTAEMIRKGQGQWSGESMVEIYKAMLASTGESHD